MSARARRIPLAPTLIVALAVCATMALGLWQMRRLAWKQGLIAQIASRVGQPAQNLPPSGDWARLDPQDYDYRHVSLRGQFAPLTDFPQLRVLRPAAPDAEDAGLGGAGEGPGFLYFAAFALADGGMVAVNRGFAPIAAMERGEAVSSPPSGEMVIAGLMRRPEARGPFTSDDDPARNIWRARNPQSFAPAWGGVELAPFTIDLDAVASGAASGRVWPRPGAAQIKLSNNHLSYALTWFGLSATLIVLYAAFLRRKPDADETLKNEKIQG